MAELKELKSITQSELSGKLHIEQPDSPERGTRGMQELFDAHPNLNTQTINLNAQRQNANNTAIMGQMETMRDELTEVIDAGGKTVNEHKADLNNPHKVTKAQVGLGDCDNTSDLDKPVSAAVQAALDLKANEADIQPQIDAGGAALDTHKKDALNPHKVTKAQVGLGNCDNTSDLDKPVSTAVKAALALKAAIAYVDAQDAASITQARHETNIDREQARISAASARENEVLARKSAHNAQTSEHNAAESEARAAYAADCAARAVIPAAGQFALSVNSTGDLILSYADGDVPPEMYIDENGDLIMTVE